MSKESVSPISQTVDVMTAVDKAPETQPPIEIRDEEIDVTDIMARIEARVAEKREKGLYRDEPWLAEGLEPNGVANATRDIADQLAMLKMAARIDLEGEPITSHRRFTGRLIVWFKRWTRFWIRRYTDGVFYEQNHFNSESVNLLSELTRQVEDLRKAVDALERKDNER